VNSLRPAIGLLIFSVLISFPLNSKFFEQRTARQNPCDSAKTQLDMNQCSGEQYAKADARLNALYTKLSRLLEKDTAADQPKRENGGKTAIQKLKTAERVWIQYRDLHCGAARDQFEGGSISPMVWANCMTKITDHRIDELKDAYGADRELE
jgi:uncharacterized protein YecT (DUF1311 family)